ncbi:unnamed protein product [Owenia fusiformis]|uniref:Uncharacterized protein n=1 Tax=Owenia fusiformis TaxID=6347 RepID=A0A8J1TRP6_OWEFU|nr:unnamed protein product [Owenia fusiformis]
MVTRGHGHDEEEHEEHDDDSHADEHLRRSADGLNNIDSDGHDEEHVHEDMTNVTTNCYTSAHFQRIHQVNASHGINKTVFRQMSPSLVQQVLDKPCEHHSHNHRTRNAPTTAQIYGFGTLAVFIISLASLGGTCIIGYRNKPVFDYILSFMLALGFAALSGDAFLHLIPTALGLHVHDHGAESGTIVVQDHVWKMLTVMGSVYLFYLLEIIMSTYYSHSHGPAGNEHNQTHIQYSIEERNENDYYMSKKSNFNSDTSEKHMNGHLQNGSIKKHNEANGNLVPTASSTSLASQMTVASTKPLVENESKSIISPLALMVTAGDAIHNFADGLAIGAAFSIDINSGISTSIAVLCHEVPHEFGDFAALLSTGMSYKKAIVITLLTQMTAFVGLYIGIAIGQQANARQWIFAVTSGMFLYVALTELLPELVNYYKHLKNRCAVLICENLGILLGTTILLLIAIFEEHIRV